MQVIERRIFITDNSYRAYLYHTYPSKKGYPSPLKKGYPILQKGKDNKDIYFKIDRLFNYYINKDGKIFEFFNSKEELNRFNREIERLEFDYTKENITILTDENINKVKTMMYCIKEISMSNKNNLLIRATREKFIEVYDNCKKFEANYKDTEYEIYNFFDYYYASMIKKLEM